MLTTDGQHVVRIVGAGAPDPIYLSDISIGEPDATAVVNAVIAATTKKH